jgi:hypothetical protein
MSVRFEVRDNELHIDQRRRGLKIAIGVFVVGVAIGAVMIPLVGSLPHTGHITCDRVAGLCTVSYEPEHDVRDIKMAAITAARIDKDRGTLAVILDRNDGALKHQWICQSPGDHADAPKVVALGGTIVDFFRGTAPTLDVTCPNHGGDLNPWLLVPAVLVGDLIFLLALTMWLQEAHTVVDRERIVMRGRSGLFRKWNIDRPRSDVRRVAIERRYVLRGQHRHIVYVYFHDEEKALALAPAFYRLPRLEERADELRKFLGL